MGFFDKIFNAQRDTINRFLDNRKEIRLAKNEGKLEQDLQADQLNAVLASQGKEPIIPKKSSFDWGSLFSKVPSVPGSPDSAKKNQMYILLGLLFVMILGLIYFFSRKKKKRRR